MYVDFEVGGVGKVDETDNELTVKAALERPKIDTRAPPGPGKPPPGSAEPPCVMTVVVLVLASSSGARRRLGRRRASGSLTCAKNVDLPSERPLTLSRCRYRVGPFTLLRR
jgi:hypothetical protein